MLLSSRWSCSRALRLKPNLHIDPLVVPPEQRRVSEEQVSIVCRAMRNGPIRKSGGALKYGARWPR
jgi:hypothetical protein